MVGDFRRVWAKVPSAVERAAEYEVDELPSAVVGLVIDAYESIDPHRKANLFLYFAAHRPSR